MPDPEDKKPENLPYKKSNLQQGDFVDVDRFTTRNNQSGGAPKLYDSKTGHWIQKERALNSGSGPHKGYWKLFDAKNNRIATLSEFGKVLGK